jgi:hypothetical protein
MTFLDRGSWAVSSEKPMLTEVSGAYLSLVVSYLDKPDYDFGVDASASLTFLFA